MKKVLLLVLVVVCCSFVSSALAQPKQEQAPAPTTSGQGAGEAAVSAEKTPAPAEGESLTDVNKKLTNPVSDIWSISIQQNNFLLDIDGKHNQMNSNLVFQPVLPIALHKNWNLITRPVITFFNNTSYPGSGSVQHTTAFGDMVFMQMVSPSPNLVGGHWLLGAGPTFIFPTASSDYTGQGKWQVGPAVIVGYLADKWALGAFVQNWTSFAGDGDRRDTNQMNLQPIAVYFLPKGWSIGYNGNILANWKANHAEDVWTVPLGVQIAKVVKFGNIPVKLALGVQYMPVRPSNFGQEWDIQFMVVPVIPKLIKGTLFGD